MNGGSSKATRAMTQPLMNIVFNRRIIHRCTARTEGCLSNTDALVNNLFLICEIRSSHRSLARNLRTGATLVRLRSCTFTRAYINRIVPLCIGRRIGQCDSPWSATTLSTSTYLGRTNGGAELNSALVHSAASKR